MLLRNPFGLGLPGWLFSADGTSPGAGSPPAVGGSVPPAATPGTPGAAPAGGTAAVTAPVAAGTPPAVPVTPTQADVDRQIAEAIAKARAAEKSAAEAEVRKAKEEADRKAKEAEGKFKELYEAEVKRSQEADAARKAAERKLVVSKVAADLRLPSDIADTLQGDTEAAIRADAAARIEAAKKLLGALGQTVGAPGPAHGVSGNGVAARPPSEAVVAHTQIYG